MLKPKSNLMEAFAKACDDDNEVDINLDDGKSL